MRMRRKRKQLELSHVIGFFLFFVLSTVISAGLGVGLGYSPRPRALGWVLFIGGSVVAVLTIHLWAKMLPAVFGMGTMNGIIILVLGHSLNEPPTPFPRYASAFLVVLLVCGGTATTRFLRQGLTLVDRVACLGLLGCSVAMIHCLMRSIQRWEIPVLVVLVGCVALLWK